MLTIRTLLVHRNRHPFRRECEVRFRANARIATLVAPLVEKLLTYDADGETYRWAIGHWCLAERPPLERYIGTESRCRIDGPLQEAPAGYPNSSLPLGGLINTPGVTAHLTPFEAHALQIRIQEAIEREILDWSNEHGLYDLPRGPAYFDREPADRAAKALIASWTPESAQSGPVSRATQGGSDHA